MARKKKIKFDDYVNMIKKWARFCSKRYKIEYEEVEAVGFEIYCIAIKKFNPAKASFSTYLYQRLWGDMQWYCISHNKKYFEQINIEPIEEYEEDLAAQVNPTADEFLEFAKSWLSPAGYDLLIWILDREWIFCSGDRVKTKPSVTTVCKFFNTTSELIKPLWEELREFWELEGREFYAT